MRIKTTKIATPFYNVMNSWIVVFSSWACAHMLLHIEGIEKRSNHGCRTSSRKCYWCAAAKLSAWMTLLLAFVFEPAKKAKGYFALCLSYKVQNKSRRCFPNASFLWYPQLWAMHSWNMMNRGNTCTISLLLSLWARPRSSRLLMNISRGGKTDVTYPLKESY